MADFLKLLGQILKSSATPDPQLLKRFAWPLIAMVTAGAADSNGGAAPWTGDSYPLPFKNS